MVYRILCFLFFALLVVSFVLSFAGITEVYIGTGFTSWFRYVTQCYDSWSFKIPDISKITILPREDGVGTSLFDPNDWNQDGKVTVGDFFANLVKGDNAAKSILDVLIKFFNFIISIINILTTIVNVVIQITQFVLTMVYCVLKLPEYLTNGEWARYGGDSTIWWWQDIEDIIESIHDGTFFNARMIN